MNDNAVIVICSRPDSSRIPRKVFKKIAGISAIEHILRRLKALRGDQKSLDDRFIPIVIAVPEWCNEYDQLSRDYAVHFYKGQGKSPLHRMAGAIKMFPAAKYVIRITHDDILIDFETMVGLLNKAEKEEAGYGISPGILEGAGVEVIRRENIEHAAAYTNSHIEHISYFVNGPDMPFPHMVHFEPRESIRRNYRLTMDYPVDAHVLEAVLRRVGPLASNDAICDFLDKNNFVLRHNKAPALSIYTCAHNAEKWVSMTLRSVPLHSRGGVVESVVVDDASTDGTLMELFKFGWNDRDRKLIVNENNLGTAASSNIALAACRSKYVMRLDADDLIKPWVIDRMLDKMDDTGAAIVYAPYDEINENDEVLARNCDPREHHHAGCALMNAKLINELRFRDGLRHWDSMELYMRVRERFPIAYLNESAWFYRKRQGSLSEKITPDRAKALKEIIEGK